MKSPEQPKEEAMEYDKAKWKELIEDRLPAQTIKQGREMGVPPEEINQYAEEVIAQRMEEQDYDFIYRFRKNMKIGTAEELKAIGEKAYQFFFDNEEFGQAQSMAKDVYGEDSEEWKRASDAWETESETSRKKDQKEWEKEEREEEEELRVTLSKEATFKDLFEAIADIENKKGFGSVMFEDELIDNFDKNIVAEIIDFRTSSAPTPKLIDYFKAHGYSKKDITIFLPIDFEK